MTVGSVIGISVGHTVRPICGLGDPRPWSEPLRSAEIGVLGTTSRCDTYRHTETGLAPAFRYAVHVAVANGDIPTRISAIESDLRALAALAASQGEWPVVRAASLAAEQLGEVMKPAELPHTLVGINPRSTPARRSGVSKQQRRGTPTSTTYPRFEAIDGDLIKVGWSRRERAEYRHRAPATAVHVVARRISSLAMESGGRFTSDDLFPVIDPQDGSDIPTYQGYLVLRWFREIALVEPDGRSQYIVRDSPGLPRAAIDAWKDLTAKEKA